MTDAATFAGFRDPLTQHLDYTAQRTDERSASAWIPIRRDLVHDDGRMRRGVIAYLTDATAGVVCGAAAVPNWIVTADLQMSVVAEPSVGPLRADAVVRRPGRRQSLGEVTVFDEGDNDRVVSTGTVNHLVIVPDAGLDVPSDMPIGVTYTRESPARSQPEDLVAQLSITTTEAGVELPITGIAVNPLGFLHGGLISVLVEEVVRRHLRATVVDLVVRFVGPVAKGTARAVPTVRTGPDGTVAQVDVVDDSGRIGAIATARLGAPLAP